VSSGKDVSQMFASVVKNVVSKNPEVSVSQCVGMFDHDHDHIIYQNLVDIFTQIKKLVYVYLVRYAEEQQDLALLSISTFQKALKV
jgi:AP-3 complex subunit beta